MTDEQAITLGRRGLAAGFRWAAGVVTDQGGVVWAVGGEPRVVSLLPPKDVDYSVHVQEYGHQRDLAADEVPDFRHAPSVGVLEAQVRAALRIEDLAPRLSACPAVEMEPGRVYWGVPMEHGWEMPTPRTVKERELARRIGFQPSREAWWVAALEASR